MAEVRSEATLKDLPVVLGLFLKQLSPGDKFTLGARNKDVRFEVRRDDAGRLTCHLEEGFIGRADARERNFISPEHTAWPKALRAESEDPSKNTGEVVNQVASLMKDVGFKWNSRFDLSLVTASKERQAALVGGLTAAGALVVAVEDPAKPVAPEPETRVVPSKTETRVAPNKPEPVHSRRSRILVGLAFAAFMFALVGAVFLPLNDDDDDAVAPAAVSSATPEPEKSQRVGRLPPGYAAEDAPENPVSAEPEEAEPADPAVKPVPEYTDSGYSGTDGEITFFTTLQSVDPTFEEMSRDELLELGGQVCYLLDNGETVDSVVEAFVILDAEPMTITRLVVAADKYLC